MSVGYMKDGVLVTCATKDDVASLQEWSERFPVEGKDASGVWHIYSVESLIAWRDAANDDPAASACLHSSLDLSGVSWEPVSSEFSGFFDGGGHTIRNASYSFSNDDADDRYFGILFKVISKTGVVSNVNMSGCALTIDKTADSNYCFTGIIAGIMYGSISGCTVSDCSVSNQADQSAVTGAIVGGTYGSVSGCVAIRCTLYSRTISYRSYCGGITGTSGSGDSTSVTCGGITGCTSYYCTITSVSDYSSGSSISASVTNAAGGIIGNDDMTVTGCNALACTITASGTGATYCCAGGVSGVVSGVLSGCNAASCSVIAESAEGYACAGGCVGLHWTGTISSCSVIHGNTNYIDDDTEKIWVTASAAGGSYISAAGGISGFTSGGFASIIGCSTVRRNSTYSTTKISASHASGTAYAGGISGYVGSANATLLANCANVASGDTLEASGTTSYIGGIAGYAPSNAIISCNSNRTKVSSDIGNQ